MEKPIPAPWNLTGNGYILLFKFSEKFVNTRGFVPPCFKDSFQHGLGSIMLVDYHSSDAGPYQELLFIPGKFLYQGQHLHTITKIYVSTVTSVINGRNNWGIPKELATFNFTPLDQHNEKISVTVNGNPAMKIHLKSGWLSFPVHTALLPFPLVQNLDQKIYYTKFIGKGTGRLAKIVDIDVNQKYFPDIGAVKPLAVLKISNFKITFPVARIVEEKMTSGD
ncbi:MAG: acetoacetate decarboxylase family protein [Halanaerobiales bacterium]|nr:acetoacetate decarboxylase family protein [Halanaerobiales bacterium]